MMTKQEPTIDLLKSYIRKCEESLESTTDYALLGALDRRIELLRYAIECIEKQIPKKQIEKFDNNKRLYCSTCGAYHGIYGDVIIHTSSKYCCWCGQAIDWGGYE